jgi:hypothetical protein
MQNQRLEFRLYDMANPIIWDKFEEYALALIERGVTRYGSKGIIEVVRYNIKLDGKPVQVNNNYTPDYARKFVQRYPQHSNFFEFRSLKRLKR